MNPIDSQQQIVDLQINAKTVMPFDPNQKELLFNHSVLINDGTIVDILSSDQVASKYQAKTVVELGQHTLLPSFNNHYCSIGFKAFHHIGSDLPLNLRIQNKVQPLETKHLSPELTSISSELGLGDLFRAGCGQFSSQYSYPKQAMEIANKHSVEALIYYSIDVSDDRQTFQHQLTEFLKLRDETKHRQNIELGLSLSNPELLTKEQLNRFSGLYNELMIKLLISLNPSFHRSHKSFKSSKARYKLLKEHYFLSPDLHLIDVFGLSRQEVSFLSKNKVKSIICPSAQLIHANALSPVDFLHNTNANLYIGTNNYLSSNLNPLKELQLLAWLTKLESQNAQLFDAKALLGFAVHSNKLDTPLTSGAMSIGAKANITAFEHANQYTNDYDPFTQIVYTAEQSRVSHLWVNGIAKVKAYQLTDIDEQYLTKTLSKWLN